MPRTGNPNHNRWTEDDERALADTYERWPVVYPAALLARHSHRSCQKRAHERGITNRRTVARLYEHIDEAQWAYLAGIIDGEGTIHNYEPRRKGAGCGWNRAVSFANTNRALIDWAIATFPGGGVTTRERGGKWQTCWQARWTRIAVIAELLEGIMPYLIVKHDKAEALLGSLPSRFSTLT